MFSYKPLIVLCIVVIVSAGCAGMRGSTEGPTDEEMIMDVVQQWKAARDTADVDALMALHSPDYSDQEGSTLEQLRQRYEERLPRFVEFGVVIDTSDVAAAVDGDSATASQIKISAGGRNLSMNLMLSKKTGSWLITGTRMQR